MIAAAISINCYDLQLGVKLKKPLRQYEDPYTLPFSLKLVLGYNSYEKLYELHSVVLKLGFSAALCDDVIFFLKV